MKRRNWSIIIGSIIIAILVVIIIFDENIIRVDPFSIDKGVSYDLGDQIVSIKHPLPPNRLDKFGTEPLGRNVHSLIVTGTKVTIGIAVLAALFRLLIAVPISFYSGFGGRISSVLIKFFSKFFNILPEIIVGYIVLNQEFFSNLNLKISIITFSIIFAVIGWGNLARKLRDEIEKIIDKEDKTNIRKKDVFKQIFPRIFANFFTETGKVLTSLCGLGILGISLGMNKFGNIEIQDGWANIHNYYPEWSGMLNSAKDAIINGQYWLPIFPLLGFTISIIGFNLVGKGFLYEIEQDEALFYRRFKLLDYHLSPKTYINEWRNVRYNMKNVITKSLVIVIIVFIIALSLPRSSGEIHEISRENLASHVEELAKDKYDNRVMETKGIDETRDYIEKELEKINLMPIFEEVDEKGEKTFSFTQEYSLSTDDGEKVNGKNIAGYIRGRTSNYPLIIVTNYDCSTNMEDGEYKGLDENGTSIGAALELAKSLKERSMQNMSNRTIVFLFTDGSKYDGAGAYEAIGTKYIDTGSFYMYFSYLGVGDSNKLYFNNSTVSSGDAMFYKHVKTTKEKIKEIGFKPEQEYFGELLEVPEVLSNNRISGITFSGISKDEYLRKYPGQKQNNVNNINFENLKDHTQVIMEAAISYAWSSSYVWGY